MNFDGYTDALANNSETIRLAMEMLVPFYAVASDVAWVFIPWFALFALAWVSGKMLFGQAKGADMMRPVSIFAAIALCLIPLRPGVTEFDSEFGLGPYLVYSVSQSFNQVVTETITFAQAQMMGGQPAPLSALSTMNQEYSNLFAGSPLSPLLNDYWANCTVGVVDLEAYSPKHWQSVGLLGPGVLGLQPDDIRDSQQFLERLNNSDSTVYRSYQTRFPPREVQAPTGWDSLRDEIRPMLESVDLPGGTGRAYRIPTEASWRQSMNLNQTQEIGPEKFMKVTDYSAEQRRNFMRPEIYERTVGPNADPAFEYDETKFYPSNCFSMYQLAHIGLNNYYKAAQDAYSVSPSTDPSGDSYEFEGFNKTTATAAYKGGLQTFYQGSLAKRLNDNRYAGAMNGLSPRGDDMRSATDTVLTEGQGIMQSITSFLLGINLDQWVLTLIGSLGLGIAFLLVLLPFFAPFAFISAAGENSLSVIFKVIIMLQLTLTLAFVIAIIGASIMAIVNAYAATSYSNNGLSTMSIGGIAVAINTACLVFPLYAGKMAYLALFGSIGASAPSGQTITAGKMAMTSIIAAAIGGKALGAATGPARRSIQRTQQQNRMERVANNAASSNLKSSGLQQQVNRMEKTVEQQMRQSARSGGRGLRSDLSSPQSATDHRPDRSGRYTATTQTSAASASARGFRKDKSSEGGKGSDG